MTSRDYIRGLGYAALTALTLGILFIFVLPLFVAGKVVGRQSEKFDAETSAQVYDSSRQYQQGVNRDIARYCRQWRSTDGAGKAAIGELIRSTKDTYEGPLTPSNSQCIEEIN